jgi:hypothetical protein
VQTVFAQNPTQVHLTFDGQADRAVVHVVRLEIILRCPETFAFSSVFIVSDIDSSHVIIELLVRHFSLAGRNFDSFVVLTELCWPVDASQFVDPDMGDGEESSSHGFVLFLRKQSSF